MANLGVGNRLKNKSYGESLLHSNHGGLGRGGSRGGGMVVLSRPRSSHKPPGSKLSVPPPLNLPSLRKEHEKFDSLGGSVGGGIAAGGTGARPLSSGLGWSKPTVVVGGDKESGAVDRPLSSDGGVDHGLQGVDGGGGSSSTAYMLPPSARTRTTRNDASVTIEKKETVLRGEDFPSLRATLSAANANGSTHKQQKEEDSGHCEELSGAGAAGGRGQREALNMSSHVDMRPQLQSVIGVHGREDRNSRSSDKWRKHDDDFFPGPLPLVRLNPRSDWGDDERDTSHCLPDTSRDHGFSRTEAGDYAATGRRDHGRQQWNNSSDFSNGRGSERNVRNPYGNDSNRFKANVAQNSTGSRSLFSPGNKGVFGSDHLSNFGREKRSSLRNEKPYVEDPFSSFDGQDPFPSSVLGVVKRKKDANKQLDFFHDPVRESFEAELERVQKVQEQERQRIIEEQERALEMVSREEEERQRVAMEHEEHQRRVEEEAREAAWREEQERLESMQKAEEQRIAREKERQRMLMEEERRKQAAKQKLQELEERIARRQAETKSNSSSDLIMSGVAKERDDFTGWEDGERMVERITNSASSDSGLSRPFDMAVSSREGSFAFTDRGKSFSSWRRDMFENGNSSSFFSADGPRREVPVGGRSIPRKDLYGGQGYMPTRGGYYNRGGIPEPHMDDFPHARGHRWNYAGNMELEADFPDRFDLGRGRGNSSFSERYYQNSDVDELYTYGRSHYPARQPRVLPPPSVHRTSFRGESEHRDTSAYEDGNIQLNQPLRSDSSGVIAQNEEELNRSTTPGRDSQSSLSVSSPPGSPTHLSHDDLDDSRDFVAVTPRREGQDTSLSEKNEAVLSNAQVIQGNIMTTASSESESESGDDDEEWTRENNEELQEQEEYDEDVGYHEEDEVREGDDENLELNREFDDMHLEGIESTHMDNLVLGFDQGVEVGMPNEEYEKSPRVDECLYVGSQAVGVSIVEQEESCDGSRDGLTSQAADVSQLVSTDASSVIVQETEKVIEPTTTSMPLDSLNLRDSAPGTVLSSQQLVSSSIGTNTLSSNQAIPNVAGTQGGSSDFPIKLQFGLFSGPSLIPSPVSAIQIGSIQMPLQLHPQLGPSLTHMHATQPPLFQFGQLRYPSPISQGILPLAPQSMSFVQPQIPEGGPPSVQRDSSLNSVKDDALKTESNKANFLATSSGGNNNTLLSQNQDGASNINKIRADLGQQGRPLNVIRNSKPLLSSRASESRVGTSSHSVANIKDYSGSQAQSQNNTGIRGRRFAFTTRNPGARSSSSANEAYRSDPNGFQRKPRRGAQRFEFRVRADGKQSFVLPSSNVSGMDEGLNSDGKVTGTLPESMLKKELPSTDSSDILIMGRVDTQQTGSAFEEDKSAQSESAGGRDNSQRTTTEGSLKRNIGSEDDADAPLQSGIVRVFKQSGIEAPSDEDDFIEVRSKRQMLNDRREQKEKEIKAKSSNMRKAQRKSRPASQGTVATRSTSRTSALSAQGSKNAPSTTLTKGGLLSSEVSATLINAVPQSLAPIGTPPIGADCQKNDKVPTMKPPQTSSYGISGRTVGSDAPNLTFDSQRKVADAVQSSLGPWSSPIINQPVMALTQTQLEEAMKPACFDSHIISIGDRVSSVSDQGISSSSVLVKDSPFSSATSPINSLLAGEKIQFGAVTSPTILPPSTRGVSHNIRPPASLALDNQMSQNMSVSQNKSDTLFVKEKHPNESCPPLEDCEAAAEAAASAVAVAAIGNDEVGNGVASCSTAISDPKGFGGADGISTGMSSDQRAVSQSKSEETLSVSLPADLSVETPPISMWPALPSPHNSSSQMLSPFLGGGPTSHFPFYDMNPMMGGPVFAFGPHEESGGHQPQPQKSNVSSSGPLGTWQQCHTGVDSFYGPPAGFTAPFISPSGSIPGVQGPPHMVVYNHFAPVGQFGQVGLSYMGTTYIPSKQPDWKRNPASALGGNEGEMSNANLIPVQRNTPNAPPAQVQHLAPGSPLLSMASPLAMFEVSPFQSSSDVSVHSRWSHVQPSSIHSNPQSMPLQQQAEVPMPSQSTHGSVDHLSLTANGFPKSQASSSLEDGRTFAVVANAAATQFPTEIGMADPPISSASETVALNVGSKSRSRDCAKVVPAAEVSGSKRNQNGVSAPSKAQSAKQKNPSGQQQYNHFQRGQKNSSGAEWSNRRKGFQGRNYFSGERSFAPAKVKQIYVAKQSSTGGTGSAG